MTLIEKIISKKDFIVIVLLIVASILLCIIFYRLNSTEGLKVVVTINGDIYKEYSLSEDIVDNIKIDDNENTLVIEQGKVYVSEADCKDKICVNHKAISNVGETIICLPHKLVVEIKGEEIAEYDIK